MSRFTRIIKLVILLAILSTAADPARAQISSSTGAIQGTVTDPQGAVIPSAKVVVTNMATGVRSEGTTLSDGTYIFPVMPPGRYKVEIETRGFKRAVLSDIVVDVTKVTVANAKLELGQMTAEVVVVEAVQTVDTRTATTGDVIQGNLVRSVPLPTRNFLDLTALQAGVAAAMGSPAALGRGTPQLFVAGQRGTVNNFVLNGVDANNYGNNNLGNVPVPNPDAIQEFRVSTSQYDASQGRSSGGNINVVLRSGTDHFHGSGFWFYRSDALNANDFFFNRTGTKKPVLLQNQYGATIGGPVPKLKETFWFFSYQGWGQKNGVSGSVSGLQPVLPTTRTAATLASAFNLPVANIDPVAVAWLNRPGPYGGLLYPSASGGPIGTNQIFTASAPSIFNENQYSGTFDRQLFHNNRLAAKFFSALVNQNNPLGGGVSLGQGQAQPQTNWHSSVSDTEVFNPQLLNEFRAGFTLLRSKTIATEGTKISDIGMSRFNSGIFPGTPAVFFNNNLLSWGGISTNNDQASQNMSYTLADTLSWSRSKHTVRGGVEFRRYHVNTFNNFASRGFLQFPDFPAFLQGTPNDVFVGTGITDRAFRAYDFSGFAQDDYRVLRRLTLNLGVRYDFLAPSIDTHNRIGNFDPSLLTAACRTTGGNCLRDAFVSPEGLPRFGTPGVTDSTYFSVPKRNFAPRVGVAWDVLGNGKLAVRSGYGIYYIRTSNQTLLQLITAAPFFQLFRATGPGVIGNGALANPYPVLPLPAQFPIAPIFPRFNGFSAAGAPLFVDPATGLPAPLLTINPFERNLQTPYNQNWNLTLQYEFLRGWVAEAGYIGARAAKLLMGRQINSAFLVNASNPGLGGLIVNSSLNANARVPIPGFSSTGLNAVTQAGHSWYDAFIFSVVHSFAKGLEFKANYTFSKSLDNNSGALTQDLGSAGGNQLAYDLNKGLSIFDTKHRLVVSYLYEIPGPKTGWIGHLLGGWSLSGVTTIQSGFPFSAVSTPSGNLQGVGSATGRANVSCTGDFTASGSASSAVDNYVKASCFAPVPVLAVGTALTNLAPTLAPGTQSFVIGNRGTSTTGGAVFGNSGRGLLRAPHQQRWDMAIAKKIPIHRLLGEQGNLQFRAEFFKLFNTPLFGVNNTNNLGSIVANNVDSAQFGRLTGTVDQTGRVIQFGLKLGF